MSNLEQFKLDATKMWHIGIEGNHYSLKPDLQEISNPVLSALLPKRNVDYYILKEKGILKIYLEESRMKRGPGDWTQNFMAYQVKTCINGLNRRYHAGFYITAITVFNDLRKKKLLNEDTVVEIFGYSHGAGAAPILGSLIRGRTSSKLLGDGVIGFEQPAFIYRPSKEVKEECKNDIWYKQGIDVVCDVPWWMKHTGIKKSIPGRKLKGVKKVFRNIFDHDIYWTR